MSLDEIVQVFQGLELTDIEPEFPHLVFGDQLRLWIDCPWRIMHSQYIVAGSVEYRSHAHLQIVEEMREYLLGQTISTIEIAEGSCDLTLHLGKHTRVQLFPTSVNYEAWRLVGTKQSIAGALNGEVEISEV